jgi:cytochrome c1
MACRNIVVMVVGCLALAGCGRQERAPAWDGFNGNAERGAQLIEQVGCGQCHQIPGIENAVGLVGPPLTKFGTHTTVAGLLPNTPSALTRWIKEPQEVLAGNAMPDMDLDEQQARDIAAYLHTLQ